MGTEGENLKLNATEQSNVTASHDWTEHFIFNTLNALQYYILIQDTERALVHLGHFSKLLRGIMLVPDRVKLYQELELLDHYLALETVRYESFKYSIDAVADLNVLIAEVPSRLMQPFAGRVVSKRKAGVENSLHVKIRSTRFYVYVDFESEPVRCVETLVLPRLTDVPKNQSATDDR